ncbi:MAG: hypothetical protein HZB92_01275 [Euryarchaeota archaeon]|nr:hypothetical protein [Euryarchaeota archaeon]
MKTSDGGKLAGLKILAALLVAVLTVSALSASLARAEETGVIPEGRPGVQRPSGNASHGEVNWLPVLQPKVASPVNVLIAMADDGDGEPLRSIVAGFPEVANVDVFDARYGTPTLATLMQYRFVFTWDDYEYDNQDAMGNVLADYIDMGGLVVESQFDWYDYDYVLGGRFLSGGYSPFITDDIGSHYDWATIGWYDPSHPIMAGIIYIEEYFRDYVSVRPGAQLVASWDDGEEFVAVKGRVVSVNLYPGYYYEFSGDVPQLYNNIVKFLLGLTPMKELLDSRSSDKPIEQSPIGNIFAANMVIGTAIIILLMMWRQRPCKKLEF